MNTSQQDREDRAVDALVAATLRHAELRDLSEDDIEKDLASTPPPSEAGKAALDALGLNIIQRIKQKTPTRTAPAITAESETEMSALYAAMNRKNASDEMDSRTKEEVEKKRREALERIKRRKKQGEK